MKLVILCGGLGTRIRDVTEVLPKPMIPIGGMPILWHIMKSYSFHGVRDFVLCLGYQGWQIKDFFINYRAKTSDCSLCIGRPDEIRYHDELDEYDWNITLAETGQNTNTGGRVFKIRKYVENDAHFCLTYGDGVADVNIAELIRHHERSGLAATITGVKVRERFGELQYDGDRVVSFAEKPLVTTGRINGGFMVFDAKRIWKYFDPDEKLVLEREPMERLGRDGQIGLFKHDGFWQCMDTPREYALLNQMWAEGNAPWKVW